MRAQNHLYAPAEKLCQGESHEKIDPMEHSVDNRHRSFHTAVRFRHIQNFDRKLDDVRLAHYVLVHFLAHLYRRRGSYRDFDHWKIHKKVKEQNLPRYFIIKNFRLGGNLP